MSNSTNPMPDTHKPHPVMEPSKAEKVNYIGSNGNHTISRMWGDTVHFKKVKHRIKKSNLTPKKKKRIK